MVVVVVGRDTKHFPHPSASLIHPYTHNIHTHNQAIFYTLFAHLYKSSSTAAKSYCFAISPSASSTCISFL